MLYQRALVYALSIALLIGFLCPVAFGQELAGRTANISSSANHYAASSVSGLQSLTGVVDVFLGKNTKGPYYLSWRPIEEGTENVQLNGIRLQRGKDYTVDCSSGTIAFSEPVDEKSIIRVEYSRDPKKAVQNTAPTVLPMTYDLLKKENSSLQLLGLYKQGDPNKQKSADLTVFGFTGERKSKESTISSMFLYGSGGGSGGLNSDKSFLDQAALKLGGSTNTDNFQLRTSYMRVGEHFAGAKEYKLQQGSEAMDLLATYKPTDILTLSSSFTRSENLKEEKKGEVLSTSEHKIIVDPKDSSKLTLSHKEVNKEKPDVAEQKTITDRLQLEGKLGESTSATAIHETTSTLVGDVGSKVTTNELMLNTAAAPNVAVKSKIMQKDSSETGEEVRLNFDVDATPSKLVGINLGISHIDADTAGRDDSQTLKLTANPSSRLSFEMGFARRDSSQKGDEEGQTLKLTSNLTQKLKLEMDYANLDSSIGESREVGNLRLQTSPMEYMTIFAALGQQEIGDVRSLSREARMELRPFKHTALSGGYKEIESNGSTVARVTEVSASTKPADFVEFSGAYKQREADNQEDIDSLNLTLKLDAGGPFKFFGTYVSNPEEKGIVQRTLRQTLGLTSDLGRLRLRGGLTLKDDYMVSKRSEITEVGMDYRLSPRSTISTGYKLDEYVGQGVLDTTSYFLGYTRRVGSDFNLYLGGKLTTYDGDMALMENRTEYEAEARLGIKF
ncbi:MAG: hypothetical protein QHH26_06355 [Armatimonadota bacterium]|nr:hypothetical protein [Armatimonadota bacterium]